IKRVSIDLTPLTFSSRFTMYSTGSPIIVPEPRQQQRIAASAYIENQSLTRIQTKLRSTDYIKTTLYIAEKKRFGNESVDVKKIECDSEPYSLEIDEDSLGSEFTFTVVQKDRTSQLCTDTFSFLVVAELTVEETRAFLQNVEKNVDPNSMRVARFYKNNLPGDDERLRQENHGCYEIVSKQHRGHRASPLFDKLNGTYFSCMLLDKKALKYSATEQDNGVPRGYIYPNSMFGTNRRSFDTGKILNEKSVIFLGDMHCYLDPHPAEWYSRPHYPLLILCQENSSTYHKCIRIGLIKLDWATNNFLRWNSATGELKCATKLHKLPGQKFGHDLLLEILVCDATVLIEQGLQSKSGNKRDGCIDPKAFFGCTACHGNQSRELTRKREDEPGPRKRLSADSSTSSYTSVAKKPASQNELNTTTTVPIGDGKLVVVTVIDHAGR
ncbi:hypothetical protein PENTCL1PPCAC_21673, partial [Pristionchus entomophagus]